MTGPTTTGSWSWQSLSSRSRINRIRSNTNTCSKTTTPRSQTWSRGCLLSRQIRLPFRLVSKQNKLKVASNPQTKIFNLKTGYQSPNSAGVPRLKLQEFKLSLWIWTTSWKKAADLLLLLPSDRRTWGCSGVVEAISTQAETWRILLDCSTSRLLFHQI